MVSAGQTRNERQGVFVCVCGFYYYYKSFSFGAQLVVGPGWDMAHGGMDRTPFFLNGGRAMYNDDDVKITIKKKIPRKKESEMVPARSQGLVSTIQKEDCGGTRTEQKKKVGTTVMGSDV